MYRSAGALIFLWHPQATWISAASEKQRRGRAGRCQPGVCFHLYSRSRSQALQPFQLPEIKRTALDEMCLQACASEGNALSPVL